MKSLLSASIVIGLVVAANVASANPGTVGYSGKPYNGTADTCKKCHTSGTAPSITVTVPTSMTAGSKQTITIKVAGGTGATSLNAAMTTGVQVAAGQNTDVPFPESAEIVAKPAPLSGGTGTYTFSVTAPKSSGTIKLWVAGMATNNNGSTAGDGVALETRSITVTGGSTGGTTDGGTDQRPDDGVTGKPVDAGTTPSTDAGGSSKDGGSDNPSDPDDDFTPPKSDSGCSVVGPEGAASAAAAWMVGTLLCVGAWRRRRK